LHGSVLGEQLLQIRAGRAIAQITYIQLAAHKKSPVDGPITRVLLSGSSTKGADRSAQTVRTAKETVRCGKYNSAHSRQTRSSNLPLETLTYSCGECPALMGWDNKSDGRRARGQKYALFVKSAYLNPPSDCRREEAEQSDDGYDGNC
jgi:hypothetical protein